MCRFWSIQRVTQGYKCQRLIQSYCRNCEVCTENLINGHSDIGSHMVGGQSEALGSKLTSIKTWETINLSYYLITRKQFILWSIRRERNRFPGRISYISHPVPTNCTCIVIRSYAYNRPIIIILKKTVPGTPRAYFDLDYLHKESSNFLWFERHFVHRNSTITQPFYSCVVKTCVFWIERIWMPFSFIKFRTLYATTLFKYVLSFYLSIFRYILFILLYPNLLYFSDVLFHLI